MLMQCETMWRNSHFEVQKLEKYLNDTATQLHAQAEDMQALKRENNELGQACASLSVCACRAACRRV